MRGDSAPSKSIQLMPVGRGRGRARRCARPLPVTSSCCPRARRRRARGPHLRTGWRWSRSEPVLRIASDGRGGSREEFAGEGTDRRVETPRSAEKEASIGWNGVVLAEQVLESRGVAAPRMATLDGLLELLGIAEKHHVSGGGAGGDSISQGELAGFVDNESVDEALRVLPCPGPRRCPPRHLPRPQTGPRRGSQTCRFPGWGRPR